MTSFNRLPNELVVKIAQYLSEKNEFETLPVLFPQTDFNFFKLNFFLIGKFGLWSDVGEKISAILNHFGVPGGKRKRNPTLSKEFYEVLALFQKSDFVSFEVSHGSFVNTMKISMKTKHSLASTLEAKDDKSVT